MQYIAHRAGNSVEKLKAAEASIDLVEVDVHLGRHRKLEVRHGKRLWPTARLWEKWYLLPADTPVPTLDEVLEGAAPDTTLWLDLKGPDPRLATIVKTQTVGRSPMTVSTKAWWLLRPFADLDGVRTIRSAGNRFELALLLWLPSASKIDGAVVHRRLLNERLVKRLLARGLLFTWAVHDRDSVAWLDALGITGVILDDLMLVPDR